MRKNIKQFIAFFVGVLLTSCAKDIVDLTGNIQGTVKDYTNGQLVSNCNISLSPGGKSTSTDANGSFGFQNLMEGTYTLSFSKSEYDNETQEVAVITGQTTRVSVNLKLSSATMGSISGVIKDYASGQLISNCNISLSPGGKSKTSSSSGTYEFTELVPGEYTLAFSKAGYDDVNTSVTVTAGKNSSADVLLKAKSSFALSESSCDFGDMEMTKTIYFFNNSDENTSYTISNVPSWLSFNQLTGVVKAAGSETLTMTVERDEVKEGEYSQNVTVSYSGKSSGSVSLMVKMKKVVLSSPTVSISGTAENILKTSFDISGNIAATGGSQVTNYGHCWNTTGSPTIDDSKTDLGSTDAICSFKSTVENLNTSTTYYVRAYAVNAQGISYSDQIAVTTQDVESDKWDGNISSSFAGGSGTYADPYIIKTGGQLLLAKNYSNCYFELGGNIDMNNHNWLPFEFSGSLNGAGYILSNLKISRSDDNQGLFSVVTGKVENLTIRGVDIQAGSANNIGTIAGTLKMKGGISNCSVILDANSIIKGNDCVGGIIGFLGYEYNDYDMSVANCRVTSMNSSKGILGSSSIGGIVGCMSSSHKVVIEKCHVEANLRGEDLVGGICGAGKPSGGDFISTCSFFGSIDGEQKVGGIFGGYTTIGYGNTLVISTCKADAKITISDNIAGGIYGYGEGAIRVRGCYSTGIISCDNASAVLGGIGGFTDFDYSEQQVLCYSTMLSSHKNFGGLSGLSDLRAIDCASVVSDKNSRLTNCNTSCTDITEFLRSCYSDYAEYYNFEKSWIWSGSVGGKTITVKCPKLAWE